MQDKNGDSGTLWFVGGGAGGDQTYQPASTTRIARCSGQSSIESKIDSHNHAQTQHMSRQGTGEIEPMTEELQDYEPGRVRE